MEQIANRFLRNIHNQNHVRFSKKEYCGTNLKIGHIPLGKNLFNVYDFVTQIKKNDPSAYETTLDNRKCIVFMNNEGVYKQNFASAFVPTSGKVYTWTFEAKAIENPYESEGYSGNLLFGFLYNDEVYDNKELDFVDSIPNGMSENNRYQTILFNSASNFLKVSITSAQGFDVQQIGFSWESVAKWAIDLDSIQIEEGTSTTNIQPFVPTVQTINAPMDIRIYGSSYQEVERVLYEGVTEQMADYVMCEGGSKLLLTAQGKNLLDINKVINERQVSSLTSGARYYAIQLKPNTPYTLTTNCYTNTLASFFLTLPNVVTGTTTNGVYSGATYRTATTDETGILWVWTRVVNDGIPILDTSEFDNGTYWVQLEEGATPTNYEAFVPAQTSPEYPSEITPLVAAGTYKIGTKDGNYLATLPEMCSVGDVCDKFMFDKISKIARVKRECGDITFNGSENWTYVTNESGYVRFMLSLSTNVKGQSDSIANLLCDKFPSVSWNESMNSENVHTYSGDNRIGVTIKAERLSENTANGFKAWLMENPIRVLYKLKTPTYAEITATKTSWVVPYAEVPWKIYGKNLFSTEYRVYASQLKYTHISNNSFKFWGSNASPSETPSVMFSLNLPVGTYKLTFKKTFKNSVSSAYRPNEIMIRKNSHNGNILKMWQMGGDCENKLDGCVFTLNEDCAKLFFQFYASIFTTALTDYLMLIEDIQLEKGSSATDFEAYNAAPPSVTMPNLFAGTYSITIDGKLYEIVLPNMYSVGNCSDKIVIDAFSKKISFKKTIDELLLDFNKTIENNKDAILDETEYEDVSLTKVETTQAPEIAIAIQGKNLFDMDKKFDDVIPQLAHVAAYQCDKEKVSETEWRFYNMTKGGNGLAYFVAPFNVQKNTNYVLSLTVNGLRLSGYIGIDTRTTSNTTADQWNLGVKSWKDIITKTETDIRISFGFNSGNNGILYFRGYFAQGGATDESYCLFKEMQLEEGSVATEFNCFNYITSKIYSLQDLVLKNISGEINKDINIPFIGNALKSNNENSNLFVNGNSYVADYINYNSATNKAYRYKYIDEILIDKTLPITEQTQAILTEPVIEEIIMENNNYMFETLKSNQYGNNISLIGCNNTIDYSNFKTSQLILTPKIIRGLEFDINEFDFDKFVLLGNYSGIEYVNAENENEVTYKYLGNDEYLYYYVYIPYINDYKFSYKTTNIGSIIVSFYDDEKNNISSDCIDIVENGKYNKELDGIIVDNTEIIIPYKEDIIVRYFRLGFKVEKDNYFSEPQLQKNIETLYFSKIQE